MRKTAKSGSQNPVPASFVLPLAREVSAAGLDPREMIRRLALPFTLDDIENSDIEFVTPNQFIAIFQALIYPITEFAHREVGLKPMTLPEIKMLCYCIIDCKTLREAIERAVQFCAMVGERHAALSLVQHGDMVSFRMKTVRRIDSASALLTDLIGLSFYHRLFSWMIGEKMQIAGLNVIYDEKLFRRDICETVFSNSITFGQQENSFAFGRAYLDKEVVRSYEDLIEVIDLFPVDTIGWYQPQVSYSEAIGHMISARLANDSSIPRLAQFAAFFNQSEATLRRRLREEGTSYCAIKERCGEIFSKDVLRHKKEVKISDLSDRLGYFDPSTFRRAFVKWTGMTPHEYRKSHSAQSHQEQG